MEKLCVLALLVLVAVVAADSKLHYLGSNKVLLYDTSLESFVVQQLEKDALGKCNPFPKGPIVLGRISNAEKIVFLGGHLKMHVENEKGTFDLMICTVSDTSLSEKEFECKAILTGALSMFPSALKGKLAFSPPNSLVEFDPNLGTYTVYTIRASNGKSLADCGTSDQCSISVVQALNGTLSEWCESSGDTNPSRDFFNVVGLSKNTFFVACRSFDRYSIVNLFESTLGSANLAWTRVTSDEIIHYDEFTTLEDGLIIGLNKTSLDYAVYDCNEKCTRLHSASFVDRPACSHRTVNGCVQDPKCGYCVDSSTCQEVGPSGPCFGKCNKFITQGSSPIIPETVARPRLSERQLVWIGHNSVLRFLPSQGSYEIYNIVDNHPSHAGKCPAFSSRPLFAGTLPLKHYVATQYSHNSILFHHPQSGAYTIWHCSNLSQKPITSMPFPEITQAPCSVVSEGVHPSFSSAYNVLVIGNLTLTTGPGGSVQAFEEREALRRPEEFRESVLSDSPKFVDRKSEISGHRLQHVGNNHILDLDQSSGDYKVWLLDTRRGLFVGPTSQGNLPLAITSSVIWMGDDRLLSIDLSSTEYMMLRFDTQPIAHSSALSFVTISRGQLEKEICTHQDCGSCVEDKRCGWCNSLNRCLPGNQIESCSGSFRCQSWTYGYCSAQPCSNLLSHGECVANDSCGWCTKSRVCLPRLGLVPLHGDCFGEFSLKGARV